MNLLIPLYLVVAAGALELAARRVCSAALARAPAVAPERQPAPRARPLRTLPGWLSPRGLEWLLLAAVVLYALQAAYSADHAKAAENIAFFYVPVRAAVPAAARRALDARAAARLPGAGGRRWRSLFAGVGFVEYYRKSLFLNPKVVAANQYDNYFRVNSVFFDPSIYGRFLALVMIMLTAVVLWAQGRRNVWLCAAVLAWLLAGLVTSFSQSSIAALLLGLTVLAAYRWDVRGDAVCGGGPAGDRRGRRRGGAGELAPRAEGLGRLHQQRDQRPHEPDLRRPSPVRQTAARGLRLGIV